MRDVRDDTPDGEVRFACDERFPWRHTFRLAKRAIATRRLDLGGLRVLTEAAVGYQRLTPVIAALAGADAVFAVGDQRERLAPRRRGSDGMARRSRRRAGAHPG